MVNKRVEETMFSDKPEVDKNKNKEYRMLPSHMYGVSFTLHYDLEPVIINES